MTNRIRYIRPDFFLDEGAAAVPADVQLFFIGLWTHADRSGRLEDRPKVLKAIIKPYNPEFDAEAALNVLATHNRVSRLPFIVRYEVEGEKYIQIECWEKEQRPHPSEKPSEIPAPPDNIHADVKKPPLVDHTDVTRHVRVDGDGDGDLNGDGDCDGNGEGDRGRARPSAAENDLPAPSRGSGHASETSARPSVKPPLISEVTIRELVKARGRTEILEMLKQGNYPIPEFLLTDQSDRQDETERDWVREVTGR